MDFIFLQQTLAFIVLSFLSFLLLFFILVYFLVILLCHFTLLLFDIHELTLFNFISVLAFLSLFNYVFSASNLFQFIAKVTYFI